MCLCNDYSTFPDLSIQAVLDSQLNKFHNLKREQQCSLDEASEVCLTQKNILIQLRRVVAWLGANYRQRARAADVPRACH